MKGLNYTVRGGSFSRAFSPRSALVESQWHKVNDYGMLSKAVTTHLAKKKKKKTPVVRADNYEHCKSLDKLQLINQQRN